MRTPRCLIVGLTLICICATPRLLALDPPEWEWAHAASSSGAFQIKSIAVDDTGASYVAGVFRSDIVLNGVEIGNILRSANPPEDVGIAKFDADGNVLWVSRVGGFDPETCAGIEVDGNGDVLVAGSFVDWTRVGLPPTAVDLHTVSRNQAVFMAKLDGSTGERIWQEFWEVIDGDPEVDVNLEASAMAIDAAGDIYIAGNYDANGINETFVIKATNLDGTLAWFKRASGNNQSTHNPIAMTVDPLGSLYLVGEFSGRIAFPGAATLDSVAGRDGYLTKIQSSNGSFLWAKHFFTDTTEITAPTNDTVTGVAADAGNVYIAGTFGSRIQIGPKILTSKGGTGEIFIAKYDTLGSYQWAERAGGVGNDKAASLAYGGTSNLIFSGSSQRLADFGGYSLQSNGNSIDGVIAQIDPETGAIVWARMVGGQSTDEGRGVAIDADDRIFLGGIYGNNIILDDTALTADPDNDLGEGFLAHTTGVDNFVGPPEIVLQPQDTETFFGETAILRVAAIGARSMSFRWYKDGEELADLGNISGSSSTILEIRDVGVEDNGNYTVTVTNLEGNEVSEVGTLTVSIATAPIIRLHPQDRTFTEEQLTENITGAFAVTADSLVPVSYQWYKGSEMLADGPDYIFTDGDVLLVKTVTEADLGGYRVVVTNEFGSTTSDFGFFYTPVTYDDWATAFFDPVDLEEGGAGTIDADPDRDRWPNGLEYLLNTNPVGADLSVAAIESTIEVDELGVQCLTLRYPENRARVGGSIAPEWSPDLINWSTEGIEIIDESVEGVTVTKRVRLRLGPAVRFGYFRLRGTY